MTFTWKPSHREEIIAALWFIVAFVALAASCPQWVFLIFFTKACTDALCALKHAVKSHLKEDSPPAEPSKNLFDWHDEQEFRWQFAVQFLASYCAEHFAEFCARGEHHLLEHPPVEDADYLSGTAWKHWCFTMNVKPTGTAA